MKFQIRILRRENSESDAFWQTFLYETQYAGGCAGRFEQTGVVGGYRE